MSKKGNTLTFWGNEATMNLNSLVLTNIQSSPYFKNGLIKLKTYHEVIDEIYYKVDHLEPWERGSRQTAGQVGMCGGVRGVGCGGIVSSAYCLLFKLYTLKLTRKQVNGLLTHTDSPFIRGLGFMYIRYTAPPADLFDWFEPYLNDEEEIDPKAGTGAPMTIGEMLRCLLTKQEWFSTLFPRIPVPIMKEIENRMPPRNIQKAVEDHEDENNVDNKEIERRDRRFRASPDIQRPRSSERRRSNSRDKRGSYSRDRVRSRSRDRKRSRSPVRRRRSHSRDHVRRSRSRERYRNKEYQRRRSRSRERHRSPHRSNNESRKHDFSDDLNRERARQEKEFKRQNRSRSGDRREESRKKEKSKKDRSESRERKKHKKSKKHKRDRSRSADRKRSSSQDR
ncbi:pre-mRNA-splicing factor 38B-like [Anneissia japonica]|uniref:pre-mRNA-splicing factor 38B-like n=1 Tax=Anneissia japonica TaxID=1529436 RepID=UPI001425B7A1|nr:pre-mRNA-splicing factor 38B-like [Anneissia japonica]